MNVIAQLTELGKDDVGVAGGKGANLGELTRAGVRVPPGFVVTADVYLRLSKELRHGRADRKVAVRSRHQRWRGA